MAYFFVSCRVPEIMVVYLLTVLNSVDLASLWNVIITLVAGKLSEYFKFEHLQGKTESKTWKTSWLTNTGAVVSLW